MRTDACELVIRFKILNSEFSTLLVQHLPSSFAEPVSLCSCIPSRSRYRPFLEEASLKRARRGQRRVRDVGGLWNMGERGKGRSVTTMYEKSRMAFTDTFSLVRRPPLCPSVLFEEYCGRVNSSRLTSPRYRGMVGGGASVSCTPILRSFTDGGLTELTVGGVNAGVSQVATQQLVNAHQKIYDTLDAVSKA